MRRILSVWLPAWPIRRLLREGWPADRPLATVENHRGQRRIAAASRLAETQGVIQGQSLAQARAVCPALVVTDTDPGADRAALTRMANWCERFSPLTAIDPPDGLWIDITGCAHLLGDETTLAKTIGKRLSPCRVAIAGTPIAARAVSRAATSQPVEVIAEGSEQAALHALPVALLRLDTQVVAGLRRVGLRNIGDLASQSRADLIARFGAETNLRLEQAFGKSPQLITWLREKHPLSERVAFAEPIGTADDLAGILDLLSKTVCARMEADGVGGRRFVATFYRVDDLAPAIEIAMAKPHHDAKRLIKLLTAKLNTIDPGFGVEAIALDVLESAPLPPRQCDMSGTPQSEDLSTVIDELANRLTPDRLWRPIPQASHIPERASSIAPPLDAIPAWPRPPGERPLRLLRPPEPIEASAPIPDDPPILFRWRGAVHRVQAATGPERIGAEWWRRSDPDERFRDYYRVEDQAGARFWLFRTGLPGQERAPKWFMHGLFG